MARDSGPHSPTDATAWIRSIAEGDPTLPYTEHTRERMADRDIASGNILHLLRYGFVLNPGQPTRAPGLFSYEVEGRTPNSGGRSVRVVVIPQVGVLKIVTMMWVDEQGSTTPRGGGRGGLSI
jgi:hypothetical protein